MRSSKSIFVLCNLILISGLIAACSPTPTSIVQATPPVKPMARQAIRTDGAIYTSSAYRPLFEDRRPRYVGDIVTITISESTSANKTGDNEQSKNGSNTSAITSLFGHNVPKSSFAGSSAADWKDKATADSSNTFSGSITATVVDVLPNGYLVVNGEKQIGFDQGTEFIRISGVVNPDKISFFNQVPSTSIADVRLEYRSSSKVDSAAVYSMFSRFFLSMLPL